MVCTFILGTPLPCAPFLRAVYSGVLSIVKVASLVATNATTEH